LFHRIQPELGFIAEDGSNEHLDTLEGRVWIQLEWRALRRAVERYPLVSQAQPSRRLQPTKARGRTVRQRPLVSAFVAEAQALAGSIGVTI
jgi:hypothetical protein